MSAILKLRTKTERGWKCSTAGARWMAAALLAFAGQAFAQDDPNPMQVGITHLGPPEYQPGQQVEIVVTIAASSDGNLTALGVFDVAPDTWTYVGARAITGELPPVQPSPGAVGQIQFAWINVPKLPYSFAYTLSVPEEAGGPAIISGQVEYRTDGERQLSPPNIITINGPDNAPPVITLVGDSNIEVVEGSAFDDPGATAKDPEDGDISDSIQKRGSVNTQLPGEYILTYTVSDSKGKSASPVTRTVVVTPKPDDAKDPGTDNGGKTPAPAPVTGNRNNRRGLIGGPGAGGQTVGPRQRQEDLANTGQNGAMNTAQDLARDDASAKQQEQAKQLADRLAKNAPTASGGLANVVPGTAAPMPGPKTAMIPKGAFNKDHAKAAPENAPAGRPGPDDDLKALDDALGGAPDTSAPAVDAAATAAPDPAGAPNTAPINAATVATPPPAPPAMEVPGLLERMKMRVAALGRAELATIGATGLAILALCGFAFVAGRIAYAGPVRRRPAAAK